MCEINLAQRPSRAWVHFATALARFFTDHKMSGLPIRAKYKHFKTSCDHTFDSSPTDSSSSWDLRLCVTAPSFSLPPRSISQRTFEHVLPCRRTTQPFLREVFLALVFFSCSSICKVLNDNFIRFAFTLSNIPNARDQEMMWVHGQILLLSSHFWCQPQKPTRIICVFEEQTSISNSALFPLQVPTELPQIVVPTRGQQADVRTSFVQEEPLDLQCLPRISMCVAEDVSKRLDIDFGILNNLGASSNFTWVYADTTSAACPSQSGYLATTSIFLLQSLGTQTSPL